MTPFDPANVIAAVRITARGGDACGRMIHRILANADGVESALLTGENRDAEDFLALLEHMRLVRIVFSDARRYVFEEDRSTLANFAADIERARPLVGVLDSVRAPTNVVHVAATLPGGADAVLPLGVRSSPTTFTGIANEATTRLVLAMPFMDAAALRVFESMAAICAHRHAHLVVVSRPSADRRVGGLAALAQRQGAMDVEVLLPVDRRNEDRELLHAKVALADDKVAYVGSANLTWGGMASTVEAGVILRGPCVDQIVAFVEHLLSWARGLEPKRSG
jgi:hypothetical protein